MPETTATETDIASDVPALSNLTLDELLTVRSDLHEQYRRLLIDIERTSLLALVQDMSAQYGPAAATVVLSESDQGLFMDVEAVLDGNGDRMDDGAINDKNSAASDLVVDSTVWSAFASRLRLGTYGGPAWHIDMQRVMEDRPYTLDERLDERHLRVPALA